ncbi:MAG: ATP-binding protein [Smithellaceae bacterium]
MTPWPVQSSMLIKKMSARMDSLHELLAFLTGLAEEKGFSKDTQNRIALVAEEALVNVFSHAYTDGAGEVELRCEAPHDPALTVEIRDMGLSFNPLERIMPDVEVSLDDRRVGGMGVLLIRRMADAVAYRREESTNVLTLTFINR